MNSLILILIHGINKADFDHEEDIHLVEKFLYDNSSPRPPKELNSENSDVVIEIFSPLFPIREGKLLSNEFPFTSVKMSHFILMFPSSLSLLQKRDDGIYLARYGTFDCQSGGWIVPDIKASHARGFVLRSLELQSLA
ncbi:hypothetical protein Tco_1319430 [Tanacetum coccineum]